MQTEVDCEVCGRHDWKELGERSYCSADVASASQPPYVQARLRLLFALWAPNRNEFRITGILCRHCGFIIYLPRPSAADLDAKYRFQQPPSEAPGKPDSSGHAYDHPAEIARSREVWRYLDVHCDLEKVFGVLDFGGMDGRLLHEFVDRGNHCSLIDYHPTPAPGVVKLGDTLTDATISTRFELIICSHVLEHLVEPRQILQQLSQHLTPSGLLFIEVPMEVWRRPPLPDEPVTHINFFTPNSLYNLLVLAGFEVRDCTLTACAHPSGRRRHGIRAVARHAQTSPACGVPLRAVDGPAYIKPSATTLWRYYAIIPEKLPLSLLGALARRIRRVFQRP